MKYFAAFLIIFFSGCSEIQKKEKAKLAPALERMSKLERAAFDEMTNEKKAFILGKMNKNERDFVSAIESYNYSYGCRSTGNQATNTALGVAAGVVGGAIINKAIGVK